MWNAAATVDAVWLIKATVIMLFTQFTNTGKKRQNDQASAFWPTATHLDVKSGQIRDRARNSGQFGVGAPHILLYI